MVRQGPLTFTFDERNWDDPVEIQYFATGEMMFAFDICIATETRDGGVTEGDECTFPFTYGCSLVFFLTSFLCASWLRSSRVRAVPRP